MTRQCITMFASCLASLASTHVAMAQNQATRPNFVVIFTDDQGYGDLGCYGSKTIRTPRIDQFAQEGTRFTSFYAQVVCGPSRSALLSGRYPVRSLGWSMPSSEVTIAELIKDAGYATGCIGKWDVSNRAAIPERMPNAQGFDDYYGTLGANDNGRVVFHHNNQQVGNTDDMASLTRLYTDKGIEFLKTNKDRPFFLYLAHTMVHSVIDAAADFKGKSPGGLYGDTVEELDFHTGRLLDAIDKLGLRDNTLVIFTTDNGPWNNLQDVLRKKHNGQIAWGSSGPLRAGKGSTYEGGLRVPCIARWPGHIPANRTSDAIFATIDFLPTFGKLAGYQVPSDRIIDGVDQTDLLFGKSEVGARDDYFYFCRGELHAVRKGPWKLILPKRQKFYGYVKDKGSQRSELYNLQQDIGESSDQAQSHPEIVRELLACAKGLPLPDAPYDERIRLNRPRPRKPAKQNPVLKSR
jgi:arylsulfatase A-like enzyme